MSGPVSFGDPKAPGFWLDDPAHRAALAGEARRMLRFFDAARGDGPGFRALDAAGAPLADDLQELHNTTRMVHSYALGVLWGHPGAGEMVDHGIRYLRTGHHDAAHGGWVYGVRDGTVEDGRKLAYGHVFVLLAGASAALAGHPGAGALIDEAAAVLRRHFWEDGPGLFCDEFSRDWTPFSTYRGMNANMHGVEALLAAYEATGRAEFLDKAGRILDFFVGRMAPQHGWRLPEHYTQDWEVDPAYEGNPMFRPAGTTPGHSLELGRLCLQHWDLAGRPDSGAPMRARRLIEQALADGWRADGGIAYTLDHDGRIARRVRYWWPVTEGIGALAALIKLERRDEDEVWYRRLWDFAARHYVDAARGGWYPEIDEDGAVTDALFKGKPDLYHALQACLYPLVPRQSRLAAGLSALRD